MTDRKFVAIIEMLCKKHDIGIRTLSDGWVLLLSKNGKTMRIVGSNLDLNSQAGAAIAKDKVATSEMLQDAGIPVVQHSLIKPNIREYDLTRTVGLLRNGDVVVKPLEGGKGTLVSRVGHIEAVETMIRNNASLSWAASPWFDVETETRLIVRSGRVEIAYEKYDPVIIHNLKLFNLSLGAKARPLGVRDVPAVLADMAMAAVRQLGIEVAAIDIIRTVDGELCILEVNAAFSLMHYAAMNDATYGEVASFYDRLLADRFAT